MDLKETTAKVQNFINTLRYQSFGSKLEFLRFNSYHHGHPMSEVLQIYVQNPEARLLGSFDFWKNLSDESSVEFGQKSSVRLYDERGKTKEVLYDLAQTTLKHDADLTLLPLRTEISSELLFNTLASLSGDSFTLDDYTSDKYFEESLTKINKFFEPFRQGLSKFTNEEIDTALEIARYNLFEEFGIYLSEEIEYSTIENKVTNSISKFSHDRFLPVYSLANNISKELTHQVQNKYEDVQIELNEIKENQQHFNNQMEELNVDIDFSSPSKEVIQTENIKTVETSESTPQIEEDSLSEADIEVIREREITRELKRGSGIAEGKFRISYGFTSTLSKSERVKLLKDEYGIGGHASPEDYYMSLFNGKGIELSSRTLNDEVLYSWSEIADRVDILINSNEYFSNDEAKRYEEWLEKNVTPTSEIEAEELAPLPANEEGLLTLDKEFLESVITRYELSDNFIIKQDDYSTDLVKQNLWGDEVVLSLDGELDVSGAVDDLTGINDFDKKIRQFYLEFKNQDQEKEIEKPIDTLKQETSNLALFNKPFEDWEERDELDPMEDFMGMLMSGEDELTVIVDGTDVCHYKISDSEDGQQVIFEMTHDKSPDTRYLVYENGKFIKNTFGDDIPDSRLVNPIGLEDLEQRLEENKFKQQNQNFESEQTQEISLFDSFDSDKVAPSQESTEVSSQTPAAPLASSNNTPSQSKTNFEFPFDTQKLASFYPGSTEDKIKANIEAIRLVKLLEQEGRMATPAEQEILAQYVGWGGLANNFFDESNPKYAALRGELKSLVTGQEYSNMLQSSLTAYYTSPEVIQAIYSQLHAIGFDGGRMLDPSMGTGNFFASMPGHLKEKSELFGVELDNITGLIAQNLQQSADIQIKGFQDTRFNDNALDLVITNVPFGQIMIGDEKYSRNYAIHDYFIKKSLDLVHEGGLVAVITSTGTMDKKDNRFREELAKQANLVSAVRLPNDAFKDIAGTDVSSDILIFQKTKTPELEPTWLHTQLIHDDKGNKVTVNRYFHEQSQFVLGQVGIKSFNGGVLTVYRDFNEEEYIPKLTEALELQQDTRYYSNNKSEQIIEGVILDEYSLPETLLSQQEPFTLFIHQKKPYFYDGKRVTPHRKQSSVMLKKGETRKGQLERYRKVEERIFDTKVKYKPIYSSQGYFDSWSNFIPIGVGSAFDLKDIPANVLEKLDSGIQTVTQGDYRYTYTKEEEKNTLKIEEVVSRQYFYSVDYSPKEVEAIEKMIDLRHSLQALLNIQHKPGYSKEEYEQLRVAFNNKYDTFVAKHGYISDSKNRQIMREDDYYQFLASVEEEAENEVTKEPILIKSSVFFEPTIQPEQEAVTVETAHDALLSSLNRKGQLNFDYMSDIYGKNIEEIIDELGENIFYIGDGEYVTREDYLSGDVKTKLAEAQNNQEFNIEDRDWSVNINALEKVIPKDLYLSDITYKYGSRFIPTEIYEKFLSDIMDTKAEVVFDKRTDSYQVSLESPYKFAPSNTYGLKKYNGEKLASTLLNQREAKIYKPDPNDDNKRVIDEYATSVIEDKGNLLKDNFKSWVGEHPEVSEKIVDIYNEKFNRFVIKHYDGQSLTVNGLAKQFTLRPHQKNAAMRIIQDGRAGLAHEVGSGKTLTMLASCMKLQELGTINKPLFVIPKPLILQFAKEIYKYFPESKVLVARTEDFQKENRKKFISRIANGKYNAIVIADSQFEKVSMSKEYQENYLKNQLFEAREHLENLDKENKFTVKKVEKTIESLKERIKRLQKKDTDTFISFEDLGIDMLYVDEAHGYKNLAPFSQLENVKGIATTRSQKAMDMQQKLQYLQSIYNNRRVVFSTGTPMSNSVVELYTMTKFVSPDILERFDVSSFDTWVSSFGIIENNFELTAAGAFKVNRRFTKFGNVPELMNTFRSTWDVQTQDMLNLPVPEAQVISHESEVTEAQSRYIESLLDRAAAIEAGEVKPFEDNMLKIVGESKKIALDMRILDDQRYSSTDSDKINQVVDNATKVYFENQENSGTQLIFCDQSVPLKYRNSQSRNKDESINHFSAYDEIKNLLIKNGIPEKEIAFIHEATDKNKEALMKDMRTGNKRILLGSTTKAGTGLNIQDKLIAVHHIDLPWRPSDLTQRNGRIIRQGNENDKVQVHYYITKGSMDAYLWQTLENKAKVINQIMLGDTKIREMEELTSDQINMSKFKAIAEADPVRQEYMETEMKLQTLERSRERFFDSQISNLKRVKKEKEQLPLFENRLIATQSDINTVQENKDNPFAVTIFYKDNKRTFTEEDKKSDVGEFFAKQISNNTLAYNVAKAMGTSDKKITHIANYRNFQIIHNPGLGDGNENERIIIKGEAQYSTWVNPQAPTGIITRIDNFLEEGLVRDYSRTEEEVEKIKSSISYIESNQDSAFSKEEEYQEVKARCEELRDSLEHNKELQNQEKENERSLNL